MSKPSNFDIILDQKPLNEVEKPTANVNFNNKKIINLATPLDLTDAANKSYVDGIAAGISWRPPVRLLDSVDNFRPTGLSVIIDGKTVVADDRVLFTSLTMILEDDRVYRAMGVGTNITGWGLETDGKAGDGSPSEGDALFVKDGDTYNNQGWVYSDTGWIQFTGLGQIEAGQGLTKELNTIYVGNGDGLTIGADNVSLNLTALSGMVLTGTSPNKSVGINVDASSLEISAGNVLQVKALGITQAHWKPTAAVDNNNQRIRNVYAPELDQDVATKKYVDDSILVENLWDRSGTVVLPHNENDNIFPNGTTSLGDITYRFSGLWLNAPMYTSSDIEFDLNSVGIILKSRTTNARYRIYVNDNGVLITELLA